MKRNLLKLIAILLALTSVMTLASATYAASAETAVTVSKTEYPVVSEPITLKVMAAYGMSHRPIEEYKLVQEFAEMTGIQIEWMLVPDSEWSEKKPLLLASDDLPDIIMNGLSDNDVLGGAESGLFIDLTNLLEDYAPNIQKTFELRPQAKAMWTSLDGNIYQIGLLQEQMGLNITHGVHWINKDWLDAAGLAMPTTIEEYEDALKTLVASDPNGNGKADEIGLSFIDGGASLWRNHGGPGALFGSFGMPDTGDHIAVQDGKVILTANTEAYRQGVQYLRRLYEAGLVDPESFSQSEAEMTARGSGDDEIYISFIDWDAYHTVGVDRADSYVAVPPLVGPAGGKIWSRENIIEIYRKGESAVITKACEYPEAAMRWIDYAFSPKVSARALWGEVGLTFEEVDGVLRYINDSTTWDITLQGTPHIFPRAILNEYYDLHYEYPPDAAKLLDVKRDAYFDYLSDEFFPDVIMSLEDATEYATLALAVNSIIDERRAVWITDGGIEEEWDQYLVDLESVGLSRYLELKQKYYDLYLENMK